jgi:hypothetical protein
VTVHLSRTEALQSKPVLEGASAAQIRSAKWMPYAMRDGCSTTSCGSDVDADDESTTAPSSSTVPVAGKVTWCHPSGDQGSPRRR